MKNAGDALADWLAKALFAVLLFAFIVITAGALWLFSIVVRAVARAIVPEDDAAGLGGSQDGKLRVVGSAVGAILSLSGWCLSFVVVAPLPLVTMFIALGVGAAAGAIVSGEGADPWRVLSAGRMVDDWTDDHDAW